MIGGGVPRPLAWSGAAALLAGAVALGRGASAGGRARRRLTGAGDRRWSVAVGPRLLRARSWAGGLGGRPSAEVDHAALLEAVARSLRGGGSLSQAIAEAVRALPPTSCAADLAEVSRAVAAGLPLAEGLTEWSGRRADRARRVTGAALTLGVDLGGASARSLDVAAAGLRDRAALRQEVRALSSQSRASATVMVLAPIAFVVVAGATDRRVIATLVTAPLGLACLASGLVLDIVGGAWMARLTRRAS